MAMLLIEENQNTVDERDRGSLYHVYEDFDDNDKSIGTLAKFMGVVLSDDLEQYLAENPDVKTAIALPENVSVTRD